MKASTETKLVYEILVEFMESIEEWKGEVEGSPTDKEMLELSKIYDIAEVELRFTINNDRPQGDDLPSQQSETTS